MQNKNVVVKNANFMDTPSSALRAPRTKTLRGRPFPAREEVKAGFTLLELLVVVLIIGILAAVAVPQYRDVVAKSTLTQLLMTDKRLHQNLKLYRLARGTHPTQILDLEWDREGTEGHGWPIGYLGPYSYLQYPGAAYVRVSISKAGLSLTCDTFLHANVTSCYAHNDFTINLLTKMKWKILSGKYIIPVS